MAGYDNIRENTIHSTEVARERGTAGGIASGISKRRAKSMREKLKAALVCKIPTTSPHYAKMKRMMEDMGIDGEPEVNDLIVIGMITKASKDHNAAVFVRDTIGEKPTETYEDLSPQSPIELKLPDGMTLAQIAKRRNERNSAEEKAQR